MPKTDGDPDIELRNQFADPLAERVIAALRRGLGDRYRVEREIGRGGMAAVYLAHDVKHSRPVALKVLHPDLTSALGADRFVREIQTIAGLRHPHILPLHDSGEVDGYLYYVMPFIDGESLRDRLTREAQLSLADTLGIAANIADAIAYAHRRGVIHRDIKPENILLYESHAILADFGIARAIESSRTRLTATGVAVGTPAYMSPEQVVGDAAIDGRSDIYSLGCVIYEMLSGRSPFDGPSAPAMLTRRLIEEPPRVRDARPEVPVEVDEMIARAMARTPENRFATAADLVAALRRVQLASSTTLRERAHTAGIVRRKVVVAAIVSVALVAGASALIARLRSPVAPSAAAIAVLPLSPVTPDSALSRLGRELAITLSANLDGVDGIRTADALTVLANAPISERPSSQADIIALARRLGVSSALNGTVLRLGDSVRVDLALHPANGGDAIAKVSVTALADDITALTNSATWALLREIWRKGGAPTPSLASVTTRSIPALRAFLDGERQIVEGRWRTAPEAFERAFTEDSTFWLAYWRYAFARDYWNAGVDSAIRAKYVQHRAELPERDRLLIEVGMADSASVRYERAKAVAERFPNYWPAWWMLSEYLAHDSPLSGTSSRDLRAALEHTLSLNPRMTSGWQHLFWEALWERDTVLSQRVLDELTKLRYDSVSRGESGFDELAHFRYLDALARANNGRGPPDSSLVEPGLRLFASMTGPIPPYGFALSAAQYGFPREQVGFSRQVIARGVSPQMVTAQQYAIAVGQAARGSWDSSVVTLDTFVARVSDPGAALVRYRVAVAGAWLGAIAPDSAAKRRTAAVADSARLAPATRAEIAWLDGLLAFARRDSSGLASARRALSVTDSVTAPMLGRSLAAFGHALAGDRGRAADSLEALEWERVERGWSRFRSDAHPFLTAIDRLAAGRWLRERGDAARAARLLTWHEAIIVPQRETRHANVMVQGLAYLELARATEAMGRADLAREYYQRFLWRYDAPSAAHRHLVIEALRALERRRAER
jgi:serine/threonine-protein kinase